MSTLSHREGDAIRTCVGCGSTDVRPDLLRLVIAPSGDVAVDLKGRAFGRGAHVHAAPSCLEQAAKGGLSKAFGMEVKVRPLALAQLIGSAADGRMVGLLRGAFRAGALAIGADAAIEAMTSGAPALLAAEDAGSVLDKGPVRRMVAAGRVVVFLDKVSLGAIFGRAEVAILAVLDEGIAAELQKMRRVGQEVRSGAWWSREAQ